MKFNLFKNLKNKKKSRCGKNKNPYVHERKFMFFILPFSASYLDILLSHGYPI